MEVWTGSYGSSSRLLNLLNLAMVSENQLGPQPSAFAISVVFGGTIGLVAANLLGYDGGAGFFIGAGLVFFILANLIIQSRQSEIIEVKLDALADLVISDLAEKHTAFEERTTPEDSQSDQLSDNISGVAGQPFVLQQLRAYLRRLEESPDEEDPEESKQLRELIRRLEENPDEGSWVHLGEYKRRLEENLDQETKEKTLEKTWSQLLGRRAFKPFGPMRRREEEVYYRRLLRLLMDQRNIRRR